MKNILAKITHTQRRYILIGVSVYIFELLVILVSQYFGASSTKAVGIGFWFGIVMSFFLQKFVTFGNRQMGRKVLFPQVVAFSLLVLFNFGFTILVAQLLTSFLPAVLIRTLALIITTIWNFYIYKTRIFKTSEGIVY